MEQMIDASDLEAISIGSTVLGTGGGGDPYIGKLMAKQALGKKQIQMLDPMSVPDDALIVPIAAFGAPVILLEKLFNGSEAVTAFEMMEKHFGREIYATMPAEAGGLNCLIPFTVAAQKGIPIIDADGMGRAFPQLQMVTFTLFGISASPITQADEKGNKAIYDVIDNTWGEVLLGSTVIPMGGSCVIGCYPMTGKQLKKAAVHGVISKAKLIGESIISAKNDKVDPLHALLNTVDGRLIFQGKVSDIVIRTEGRWNKGECHIEGLNDFMGQKMQLDFQNEFLVASINEEVVVCVPDLITILDIDSAEPITAETIQYGFRISVIAMPCDEKWRTVDGLELAGPKAFGYDYEYIEMERVQLQGEIGTPHTELNGIYKK